MPEFHKLPVADRVRSSKGRWHASSVCYPKAPLLLFFFPSGTRGRVGQDDSVPEGTGNILERFLQPQPEDWGLSMCLSLCHIPLFPLCPYVLIYAFPYSPLFPYCPSGTKVFNLYSFEIVNDFIPTCQYDIGNFVGKPFPFFHYPFSVFYLSFPYVPVFLIP